MILSFAGSAERIHQEFTHEAEVMARLSHENIVTFVGFAEDLENGKAWIVLSWEPNGNIREFLAKGDWEIPERISLVRGRCNGGTRKDQRAVLL